MASFETYDYTRNPHIDDFKTYIRQRDGQSHPWIEMREVMAKKILDRIPHLAIPFYADPRLIPHETDQELVLTPYDDFDGMRVDIPPEEYVRGWKVLWDYNLGLANHPARIHAMRQLEERDFQPPQSVAGIIDDELGRGKLLQLADLGHAVDITNGLVDGDNLVSLAEKIGRLRRAEPGEISQNPDLQAIRQEVEDYIKENSFLQTHRTELLATGPFTLVGGMAFSYIGAGGMPDVNGSVLAGETLAKMFVRFGIPHVGKFSAPNEQAKFAQAIMNRLTIDDPLLEGRSREEKEFIVNHWRRCPTGLLEISTDKAVQRAEALTNVGVQSLREYGHTRGWDQIFTLRELRRLFPHTIIGVGQGTQEDIILAAWYEGADEVIIGVGGGGRCTTAYLSQLIPTNAVLPWRLRGKIGIPITGEGGAVDEPIVAALVGFSQVNGSGSIGGGTFEAPGGLFFLTRDGVTFQKPYGGEASRRFKHLSERIYATGVPYIPEGEESFRNLAPLQESMTQKIIWQQQRVILGAIVLGVDAGPFVIQAIQQLVPSPLFEKTRTASYIQDTH